MICKKRKFKDEIDAMIVLYESQRKRRLGDTERNERKTYFCKQCKKWHLTSK
jgi:hypothetical protein